jgi:hypothetical protein
VCAPRSGSNVIVDVHAKLGLSGRNLPLTVTQLGELPMPPEIHHRFPVEEGERRLAVSGHVERSALPTSLPARVEYRRWSSGPPHLTSGKPGARAAAQPVADQS